MAVDSNRVKKATIGAIIQLTITRDGATFDLTGATITGTIKKPQGGSASWTFTISNAARGIVTYTTTAAGDLDQAGEWLIEPKIVSGGNTYYGETVRFRVEDNL